MLLTALITPFLEDTTIDFTSLEKMLQFQLESKVDGLVLLGTTAETPTLSNFEQRKVLELAIATKAKLNSQKKLFAGVSDNATSRVLEKIESFNELAVDGYLISSPYYNKPPQNGLIQHFLECSKATKKDIILYNIPGRTAVNFLPNNLIELLKQTPNIKYIKESSGNLSQMMDLIGLIRENNLNTQVFCGDDDLTLPVLSIGGTGLVSVLSNIYPNETADLITKKELDNFYKLLPIIRDLFKNTNPIPVKNMLFKVGLIASDQVRLPLIR